MRSAAVPLLWEIWRRGRGSAGAIAVASALSWLIDFTARNDPPGRIPAAHNQMLALVSFVILLAMFSYIESGGDQGMGRFPRRLFTLPVSTFQLVAVPVVAGIVAIELLYLLWVGRLAAPGASNHLFVAVLLGAFMVSFQAVLWTLERLGPLRLVVLGGLGITFFWIGFLPAIGGSVWRTERVLGGVVAALAVVQFLLVWRYVARVRSAAESDGSRFVLAMRRFAEALPRRRSGFRSSTTAHVWFEWRCSGTGYPSLVAGALLLLLLPASMLFRGDPGGTVRILLAALALPLVVAVPSGLAFSKPLFWSEEMSLPSFVAVKPLADAELIAIKIRVAAGATLIAWLLVLGFLSAWLPLWANRDGVSLVVLQLRALHEDWWPAMVALVVTSAMFVSWRFLVAGLWAGMSGSRALFMSLLAPFGVVIISSAVFDVAELPGWITDDLRRLDPFLWAGALAVVAKGWLAARGFRLMPQPLAGRYLAVWLAGVACLLGLAAVPMSDAGRNFSAGDRHRVWASFILVAVLLMPIARLAWAPWFLGRNRHRR